MVTRILVGLIGIPVVIGIIGLGGWFFAGAVIVVTTIALREFYRLAQSKHAEANVSVGVVWSICIQLCVTLMCSAHGFDSLVWLLASVAFLIGGLLLTLTAELWRARENALLNTAITAIGVLYISGCLTALIVLRGGGYVTYESISWFATPSAFLVMTLFVSVWMCDSVAYFVGMKFGKHKLFPRVSPKKSWEGAAGGFVGAVVSFAVIGTYCLPHVALIHLFVCGVIVGVLGQIGDLAESLLKRDASVKDSSQILPGHGGILDRFDSILFVAPLILIYIQIATHHNWISW
ncbi:MAG: phosphatidate cytidylyltransferase [bacterium]|nr:phosphatidate cytidylyltransferase [bacterium]